MHSELQKHLPFKSRREWLWLAAAGGIGILNAGCRSSESRKPAETKKDENEEVSPAEDLMREHGVLDRVLLIYEQLLDQMGRPNATKDLDPSALRDASSIIRNFIEDYHEKLEEDHLFPRFESSGKLADLVRVLREQHQAGRTLTDQIEQQSEALSSTNPRDRKKLQDHITAFIRMYRPHAAREDTVLFPAFRQLVSSNEYDSLGEQFEDQEHKLFGEDGFEKMVEQVAGIERRLGIADLERFTPKV